MGFFGKKDEDRYEENPGENEFQDNLRFKRRLKDLNPENKKKRKEPVKPWGKKERIIVLSVFLGTVVGSGILSLSARGFKIPNFPRLKFSAVSFSAINPLREQTIIVGKKTNSKETKIISLFEEKVKPLSGIYSFYVYDLTNGESFGSNEKEKMQAASLIKLPVIYTFYKEAEKGNVSFDEKIKFGGETLTYRDLIRLMGKRSDNKAFSVVRQKLGDSLIKKYISDLGLTKTDLEQNSTTAEEISVFFQEFWKFDQKEKNEILDFLTDTIYEDYLPKGIPDNIKVAHKYGREIHVINDGGIVLTEKPFIIILMTDKIVESEAMSILPELSKLVFEGYAM